MHPVKQICVVFVVYKKKEKEDIQMKTQQAFIYNGKTPPYQRNMLRIREQATHGLAVIRKSAQDCDSVHTSGTRLSSESILWLFFVP